MHRLEKSHIDAYIPPEKQKHGTPVEPAPRGRIPAGLSRKDRTRRKLRTKRGRQIYRLRKGIVEPVSGQVKTVQGIRQFLLQGRLKMRAEWLCSQHTGAFQIRGPSKGSRPLFCLISQLPFRTLQRSSSGEHGFFKEPSPQSGNRTRQDLLDGNYSHRILALA
jgi:hypothetical protein